MTTNPVYRREITVSARSIRLPLIIAAVNFITAACAVIGMWRAVADAPVIGGVDVTVFHSVFRVIAALEFVLMIFVMPALTAGSLSGEKERGTLDLMLTTRLTPGRIVAGKLMSALSGMFIVILSGLPVMMLAYIYGGVHAGDVLLLAACFFAAAFLSAAQGLFCSAVFAKTAAAAAVSYGILLILTIGTAGAVYLRYRYSGSAGNFVMLLGINPLSSFCVVIGRMTGIRDVISMARFFAGAFAGSDWSVLIVVGIGIQLLLGMVFALMARAAIKPGTRR